MRTTVVPSVLWREGMFLSTQHFQALAAELVKRIASGDRIGTPCTQGLIHLAIDDIKLGQDVFAVREAEVLFGDGTLVRVPGNAEIESAPFAEHFKEGELLVWLALPEIKPNVPQIEGALDARAARFRADPQTTYDENLVDSKQDIDYRVLRPRLFFGQLPPEGFECLPIARLVREGRPVVESKLSPTFVPQILTIGAAPALMRRLAEAAEKGRARVRDLAVRVPSIALLANIEKGTDLAGFLLLQAFNRAVAVLEQLARSPALDPSSAYFELVRLCGDLAVFGGERAAAELPALESLQNDANSRAQAPFRCNTCFQAALAEVERLLDAEVSMPYDCVPFKQDALRERVFQCRIPDPWLAARAVFYLAIEFARPGDEVAELVDGGVVKLTSPGRVDVVQVEVAPDVTLLHQRTAPLSFPKREGLHFFRIDSEGASRDSWLRIVAERSATVVSSLSLLGEDHYHLYAELPK